MHGAVPDVLKNNSREINLLSLEPNRTGKLHDLKNNYGTFLTLRMESSSNLSISAGVVSPIRR